MQNPQDLLPIQAGFPRPNWESISKIVERSPESDWNKLWEDWARTWVDATAETLGRPYRVSESDNFLLLTAQDDRYVDLLSAFLERTLRKILSMLDGIASDDGFGKNVVLMFNDQDSYYQYMSYFYPEEGEFILSSGVFLNADYGHFALPFLEMSAAEATSAHEMTHACLRHLPIPLWLNEGFAVTVEEEICGYLPLEMTNERFAEHAQFWNSETIQEFWSGFSFNRTDDGSELSYELARYCVKALAHDYDVFSNFANAARFEDGGESAAINAFGGSLGGLIQQFFGDGDWSPKPTEWHSDGAS